MYLFIGEVAAAKPEGECVVALISYVVMRYKITLFTNLQRK